MRVEVEPAARRHMERLCDAVHPEECGGYLLGSVDNVVALVADVFPIPNVSPNKSREYVTHSWGGHWGSLHARTLGLSRIGTFHSHPNGAIPSGPDMVAYSDSDVHLWVIHHAPGHHTFQASKGTTHLDLSFRSAPVAESWSFGLTSTGLGLGDLAFDRNGLLHGDPTTMKLLSLPAKSRRNAVKVYSACLSIQSYKGNYIYGRKVAEQLGVTTATVRRWSTPLVSAGLIEKSYGGYRTV